MTPSRLTTHLNTMLSVWKYNGMPLAEYACNPADSSGRVVEEPDDPTRSAFQRDRDRIIHCTAFRRLKHKSQVFVSHEGDHYRTRLTHTLEVAQIARSIARLLGLDEDLTEAIALAHDLGHTPFGHAGERALDRCMTRFGGFDHNHQTFRIVTALEKRYASFDGLNLTHETLESIVKHNGPLDIASEAATRDASVFVEPAREAGFNLAGQGPLEAQLAAICDDIAYNAHDIDDGLRAGLFAVEDVRAVPMAAAALEAVERCYPALERPRLIHEMVRRLVAAMARDVTTAALSAIQRAAPVSVEEVRKLDRPLIVFSSPMEHDVRLMSEFLQSRMYQHPDVQKTMNAAELMVGDLFAAFFQDSGLLPGEWGDGIERAGDGARARQICDFIAGMTDRYAIDMHYRICAAMQ